MNPLELMQKDPEFVKFSYSEQVEARMTVLGKMLEDDEEYQKFSPAQKRIILQKIAYAPPALEDKSLEKHVSEVGEAFRGGNQKAQRQVFASQAMTDWMTASAMTGMASKLVEPVLEAVKPRKPEEPLQWWQMGSDEDKRKVLEYYDVLSSQDKELSVSTKRKRKFLQTSVNLGEIIGLGAVTGGSWYYPAGLGKLATGLATRIGAKAGSKGVLALARTTKIVGHGVIEGGVGILREALKEQMSDLVQDPEARNVFSNSGKHFKDYFLWDVLINFGLSVVLPQLGGIGKVVSGKLDGKQWVDGLRDGEWDAWLKRAIRGEDVPGEVLDQLSPQARAWFETVKVTGALHDNVTRLNKDGLLTMIGGKEGYAISRVTDGIEIFDATGKVGKVANMAEYEKWLVRNSDIDVKGLETGTYGATARRLNLQENVAGDLGDASLNKVETAINVIAPENGTFRPKQVKDFARLMLVNSGVSDDLLRKVEATEIGDFIELAIGNKTIGRITKTVSSKADELSEVDGLLAGIDDFIGNTIPKYGDAPYYRVYKTPKRIGIEYNAPGRALSWKGKEIPSSGRKWFKDPGEVEQFKDYLSGMGRTVTGITKVRDTLAEKILGSYQESLSSQYLFSPAFVEETLKRYDIQLRRTKQGHWAAVSANGDYQVYDKLSDIGKDIMKKELKFDDLAWYFKQYEGLELRYKSKTSDAVILETSKDAQKLGYSKKVLYEAENLQELIDRYPQLINRLPERLAPKITLLGQGDGTWVGRVKYSNGVAVGDHQTILRHLNNFYPESTSTTYLGPNKYGSMKVNRSAGTYEVFLDDIGERKTFRSIEKARQYMTRSSDDMQTLTYKAAKVGYQLDVGAGQYSLYNNQGLHKSFTRLADLKEELRKVPDPEFAPSLIGKTWDDLAEQYPKPETGTFKPMSFAPPEEGETLPAGILLGHRLRPHDALFEDVFRGTKDDFWISRYTELENSLRALDVVDDQVLRVLNSTFRKDGKWIKFNRRKTVQQYMNLLNGNPEEAAEFARRTKMTAFEMEELPAKLKQLTGENQRGGLFHAFDISYDDYVNVYLPQVRKHYLDRVKDGIQPDGEIAKFLDATFDGHAPSELKEFYRYQRVSDVISTAMLDDPLEALTKYIQVGYRKRILAPTWERVMKEFQAKKPTADPNLSAVFQNYMDDLMGVRSAREKQLFAMTVKVGEAVKKVPILRSIDEVLTKKLGVDTTVSKDFIDYIRGVSYLSAMGMRFWLAVRNTFQPWVTTAPRIGNHWVAQALRNVVRDDGTLVQNLRNAGVLRPQMALPSASSIFDGTSLMSRASRFLLKWYGSSDDLNRAVTYEAMRLRFNDAVKRYTKKIISEDDFYEMSGLNVFDDFSREQAKGFIREGKWSTAVDFLGKKLNDETQFIYRAGGRPDLFRGTTGRLFGQFGTWPIYYVENIRRALRQGSMASKMAFVATWTTNSFLLYEGFKNLGVNANNFLIWTPMQFTGGPLFHTGVSATQLIGSHYRARQARAEVLGITVKDGRLQFDPRKGELWKWITPGSFLARSVSAGVEALNDGDWYRAALNFGSFPIDQEWFQYGGAELGIKSPFQKPGQ